MAVWLKPRRGLEKEIARLNASEIVGEMSFVDARPPSAMGRGGLRRLRDLEGGPELYLAGEWFDRMVKRVMES